VIARHAGCVEAYRSLPFTSTVFLQALMAIFRVQREENVPKVMLGAAHRAQYHLGRDGCRKSLQMLMT